MERDANLLKLKRALPLPPGSYLVAKMLMSIAFAALAVGTVTVTALVAGKLTLSAGALLAMVGVLVFGAVPFCAIGLFIGAFSSGNASPAFANLIYLPGMWLSGMFFPLPKVMAAMGGYLAGVSTSIKRRSLPPACKWTPTRSSRAAFSSASRVLLGGLAIRRLARSG